MAWLLLSYITNRRGVEMENEVKKAVEALEELGRVMAEELGLYKLLDWLNEKLKYFYKG